MSGHRTERVGDKIRQILARLLREEVRDPRIGFVTVTDTELSPDLRNARVYVSFMKPDDRDAALAALNHAAPYIRRSLAREAGLRHTPDLRFYVDESLDTGFRVEKLLRDARDDDDPEAPS